MRVPQLPLSSTAIGRHERHREPPHGKVTGSTRICAHTPQERRGYRILWNVSVSIVEKNERSRSAPLSWSTFMFGESAGAFDCIRAGRPCGSVLNMSVDIRLV